MKPQPNAPNHILEFTPAMRRLIEDAIESLILLLDEIDGDDDLEDDNSLEDGGDDEHEADAEPWLGSNAMFNQGPWGYSSTDDREDDDEREPQEGVLYL
jgi:hypothetical protein